MFWTGKALILTATTDDRFVYMLQCVEGRFTASRPQCVAIPILVFLEKGLQYVALSYHNG